MGLTHSKGPSPTKKTFPWTPALSCSPIRIQNRHRHFEKFQPFLRQLIFLNLLIAPSWAQEQRRVVLGDLAHSRVLVRFFSRPWLAEAAIAADNSNDRGATAQCNCDRSAHLLVFGTSILFPVDSW